MKKLLVTGLLALAMAGCGGEDTPPKNEVAVDKASFTGKWALAVDSGLIGCDNNAVYIKANDGNTYALNGTAQKRIKQMGLNWLPVDRDSSVWLDDPNNKGAKIDVSDMIAVGLKLCEGN